MDQLEVFGCINGLFTHIMRWSRQLARSESHILGGGSHPEVKRMIIHRHDEAHRFMINAINKGDHRSFFIVAYVGTKEMLRDLGVHHKQIVKWVLPNNMLAMHSDDPEEARATLRPDNRMVKLTLKEQRRYSQARPNDNHRELSSRNGSRVRQICIVEGGYVSGTKSKEKFLQKTQHHELLVSLFTQCSHNVLMRLMHFRYAGTVYESNLPQ